MRFSAYSPYKSLSRPLRRAVCISICGIVAGGAPGQNYRSTLALAPYSLSFGNVLVGKTTDAQTITLLNTGPVPARIDKITITGPFKETTNCPVPPASLNENVTCGIEVTFTPTGPSAASGTVSVFHDGRSEQFIVSLTGSGTLNVSAAKFSPPSIDFGERNIGDVSPSETIILSNAGQKMLFISKLSTEGDFTIAPSSTCEHLTMALAPNASCTLAVTFTPLGPRSRQGAIVVNDDAEDSPQRVRLSGAGHEQ